MRARASRVLTGVGASATLSLLSIDAEGVWAVRMDELDVPCVERHPIQVGAGG